MILDVYVRVCIKKKIKTYRIGKRVYVMDKPSVSNKLHAFNASPLPFVEYPSWRDGRYGDRPKNEQPFAFAACFRCLRWSPVCPRGFASRSVDLLPPGTEDWNYLGLGKRTWENRFSSSSRPSWNIVSRISRDFALRLHPHTPRVEYRRQFARPKLTAAIYTSQT